MILGTFLKQPAEYKDYDIDYKPWLEGNEDDDTLSIVTVKSIICLDDPYDQQLECAELLNTKYHIKVWMAGGTSGYAYKLTLAVETAYGRIDESELIFAIEDI